MKLIISKVYERYENSFAEHGLWWIFGSQLVMIAIVVVYAAIFEPHQLALKPH